MALEKINVAKMKECFRHDKSQSLVYLTVSLVNLTSFWPDCKYMSIHLLFEMIGKWTSLRTGDIDPYSDLLPQPVTVPVLPTNKLLVDGKQIGIIFGCKDKANDRLFFFADLPLMNLIFLTNDTAQKRKV